MLGHWLGAFKSWEWKEQALIYRGNHKRWDGQRARVLRFSGTVLSGGSLGILWLSFFFVSLASLRRHPSSLSAVEMACIFVCSWHCFKGMSWIHLIYFFFFSFEFLLCVLSLYISGFQIVVIGMDMECWQRSLLVAYRIWFLFSLLNCAWKSLILWGFFFSRINLFIVGNLGVLVLSWESLASSWSFAQLYWWNVKGRVWRKFMFSFFNSFFL